MSPTAAADPKIIDIISKGKKDDGKSFVSLEYFPPRTEEGVKNLYARMERMKDVVKPAFTDVTWGAGGSTADLSLELALNAHKTGHVANLHLTCTNIQPPKKTTTTTTEQTNGSSSTTTATTTSNNGDAAALDPKENIRQVLVKAHEGGIRNIVALRGDPPAGETEWKATEGGFTCALDLVKFIRSQSDPKLANDFGIAVAGYPEGHPNAITEVTDPSTLSETEKLRSSIFDGKTYCCLDADYKKEMIYLKEKIDAGADIIITQMFFDTDVFIQFCRDCTKYGIHCPIIPGLMCINAYGGFCKMTKFCKTRVPTTLQAKMDSIKDDPDQIKSFGISFGTEMCTTILNDDAVKYKVLHFYTLNLEKVVYGILDNLGLSNNALSSTNESDSASMIAKGSAWARIGDNVTTPYGTGIVQELDYGGNGAAKIQLNQWPMANGQHATAYLQKGQFSKVF